MQNRIFTISEINLYVKAMMEQDFILTDVTVKGEISNFKWHSSGHIYCTLKDAHGAIKAVMFKGANARLKFRPEDGMKVLARGRISVYERDGIYQLYIEELQPDGVGALYIAFEQLKAKLSAEGLFDDMRKKPLPSFPVTIGVVTSPTGAAIRDILNILKRRFPFGEVLVMPVMVQGEQAGRSIAAAIQTLNQAKACEVMIVGRGGGSIEDLWAFNEEVVARAIAASDIPVISAVGHETDFTIADFVCDLRAPTPSAAAELAVPSMMDLKAQFNYCHSFLLQAIKQDIENKRLTVKHIAAKLISPQEKIISHRLMMDALSNHLKKNIQAVVRAKREQLAQNSGKLHALSPLSVLSRGYAIAKTTDGVLVKCKKQVKKHDHIHVQVADGEFVCEVI
ncbi:MAG: exodeoxyribonuclease VII large subunit [Hyphomonadaceae bacterium]|nr:exodeoxyribonuclease VII large subunit [Clostridia bacterium]